VVIEDLKSGNGVFVNGAAVRRTPLKPGDVIRIGSTEFLVHL
jgi:pSer/pThr/pTyr-binding forkhead associated (FHA) protein